MTGRSNSVTSPLPRCWYNRHGRPEVKIQLSAPYLVVAGGRHPVFLHHLHHLPALLAALPPVGKQDLAARAQPLTGEGGAARGRGRGCRWLEGGLEPHASVRVRSFLVHARSRGLCGDRQSTSPSLWPVCSLLQTARRWKWMGCWRQSMQRHGELYGIIHLPNWLFSACVVM